jgi:hypothetical protein
VDDHAAQHDRADRVQLELEGGDDAEVATAAAQRPEEVLVLGRACPEEAAIGGDDIGGEQVVAGEAVLGLQPASVSPATPVLETVPPVVARPKACVSRSSSAQITPACTCAVRRVGSTRMPFIGERSITMPSSQVA